MIFVTVGTHEQQFNRLIESVDNLKKDNVIKENVFIQTGFSNYIPKYCEWNKLLPYCEMIKRVEEARIIITHGGPSSMIMPLQIGKVPIVVPRQRKYGEHVNDHQIEFARTIAERMGMIIVVEDLATFGDVIGGYEEYCVELRRVYGNRTGDTEKTGSLLGGIGNNRRFNEKLEELVWKLGMQ